MNYLKVLGALDKDENNDLSRILILLSVFRKVGEVKGLTKLAKLDFFLRYPLFLEKALKVLNKNYSRVDVKSFERENIESKMVRFKYGPWDFRYRRFINQLIGMDLVYMYVDKGVIYIGVTEKGMKLVEQLKQADGMDIIYSRALLIRTNLNRSGTNLMKFVYHYFPEIGSLSYGEEIEYED